VLCVVCVCGCAGVRVCCDACALRVLRM